MQVVHESCLQIGAAPQVYACENKTVLAKQRSGQGVELCGRAGRESASCVRRASYHGREVLSHVLACLPPKFAFVTSELVLDELELAKRCPAA